MDDLDITFLDWLCALSCWV